MFGSVYNLINCRQIGQNCKVFYLKRDCYFSSQIDTREKVSAYSLLICLFGVLWLFQHCTCHMTTGSWKGRGNQYIQLVKVLYCKLLTNGKQLPAFPLEVEPRTEPLPQRWEARVLPLFHHGPYSLLELFFKDEPGKNASKHIYYLDLG